MIWVYPDCWAICWPDSPSVRRRRASCRAVLGDLAMMKRLAVGLIGLLAGAELRLTDLRLRIRSILSILACQMGAVLLVLWAVALAGRGWIPFLGGLEGGLLLSVSLLFAATLTVNSPMVTLALLTETRAEGPLAKTTLGVVLVADVVVILIFTVAFSLAKANLGGQTDSALAILRHLLGEVFGSMLAGALIGAVLSLYLRYVKRELVVFAVVLVFATAAAAQALGFELLLSLLVAGFFVENVAPVRAEPLIRTLHLMAVPVFVIFFAIAGAELQIETFASLWPLVLAVALLRAGAIYVGARTGLGWEGLTRWWWSMAGPAWCPRPGWPWGWRPSSRRDCQAWVWPCRA